MVAFLLFVLGGARWCRPIGSSGGRPPGPLSVLRRWPLPRRMSMLTRWWRRTVKRAGQPAWHRWPWRAATPGGPAGVGGS